MTKPLTTIDLAQIRQRYADTEDCADAGFHAQYDVPILLEVIERQQAALRWALGENGDFRERLQGEGRYWWRTELRARAALIDEGEAKP